LSVSVRDGLSALAGQRALLRIARRDALRAPGRSSLIVLMIALPVFALSFVDVLVRTAQADPDEAVTWRLGATQYMLRAEHPIGSGFMQAPDPEKGGIATSGSTGDPTQDDGRYADPAAVRPAGGRVLTQETAEVDVRVRGGADRALWMQVAAADPAFAGRFELLSGRAPRDRGEVLVTPALLERTGRVVTVMEPRARLRVVGTARQAGDNTLEAVFAPPGTLALTREQVFERLVYVADAPPLTWDQVVRLNAQGVSAYDRDIVLDPPPRDRVLYYAAGGPATTDELLGALAIGAVVLILAGLEVVLLAGAAFAVGTRRQSRSLALLTATGASPRQVRRVVLGGGLVLGTVAAAAGVAAGILAAAAARPLLERLANESFARFDVRPLELLAIAAVAVVTGVLAAIVPARNAARQDVVAALAARRDRVAIRARVPAAGVLLALLGAGLAAIGSVWAAAAGESQAAAALIGGGAGLTVIGLVVLSPVVMALAGRLGAHLPLAGRLALRDAARHRGRSAPAMAAVLVAVSGSAALLLYVAALDRHDRRAHMQMLPVGTAGVPLLDYTSEGDAPVRRPAGPLIRAVESHLPVRSRTVVWMAPAECERCRRLAAPRDDGATAPSGDAAVDEGAPWVSLEVVGHGVVVGSPALFERLNGRSDPAAARRLAAGGAARLATPYGELGGTVLSPAAARRLRVPVAPTYVLFELDRLPTDAEQGAAGAALRASGTTVQLAVERGYRSDFSLGLLALVLAAGVITLGAAGIATGLAQADARPDHATLAAVGADPRMRRSLAAMQALAIAAIGTVLGVAAGLVPALALVGATPALEPVLPWAQLLALLAGVPLLAAAAAWLCTRSRMPMDRRLAR
jgi:putative ABC transport system permease protein